MDFNDKPPTGTHLLTFEKVVDIDIFDGRIVTRNAAKPAPAARAAARARRLRRRVLPLAIGGALLAIVGVAIVSYAGFQLYGTNLLAARDQERLGAEFDARRLAGLPAYTGVIAPPQDPVDPAAFEDPEDVPVLVGTIDQAPPIPPEAALLGNWVFESPPEHGTSLGRLVIPQIHLDWIVVEGINVADLRKGPGHMPNTAMPGQLGNAVISGHRTTYGAPFNRINELVPGDRFTVETLAGVHTYQVVSLEIVRPRDVWVTTQWNGAWLTLTTCNPEYSSRQRLVVFAKLIDGPNAAAVTSLYGTEYPAPTSGGPPIASLPPVTPTTTTTTTTATTTPGGSTTTEPFTTTTTEPAPTTTTTEPDTTTTTTEPDTTTTTGA